MPEQSYHHGNLRLAMTETALQLLNEHGVDSITMREIARRVGVSHSAAYRHFKSKEALLAAIAQDSFEQLTGHLRNIRHDDNIPMDAKFQQFGIAYIAYAANHPAQYQLMYGSNAIDNNNFPELRVAVRALAKEVFTMIKLCQQARAVNEGNTVKIADAAWSLAHGAAMLIIDGHIQVDDIEQFGYEITYLMRRGIAPTP